VQCTELRSENNNKTTTQLENEREQSIEGKKNNKKTYIFDRFQRVVLDDFILVTAQTYLDDALEDSAQHGPLR